MGKKQVLMLVHKTKISTISMMHRLWNPPWNWQDFGNSRNLIGPYRIWVDTLDQNVQFRRRHIREKPEGCVFRTENPMWRYESAEHHSLDSSAASLWSAAAAERRKRRMCQRRASSESDNKSTALVVHQLLYKGVFGAKSLPQESISCPTRCKEAARKQPQQS